MTDINTNTTVLWSSRNQCEAGIASLQLCSKHALYVATNSLAFTASDNRQLLRQLQAQGAGLCTSRVDDDVLSSKQQHAKKPRQLY